uniref:spatacsin-like n=1 Tax=Myxine glutinosa TaxID=7769 RepID=UPI00358FE24B
MIQNDRSVGLNVRLAGPGSAPSVHCIRRVVGSTPGPFACLLPEEVVLLTALPGLGELLGHTLSLSATDLRWENHDVGTFYPPPKSRLVIWSTNGGLSIYEVEQVAGRLNVVECYSMTTEELCNRLGFPSEDSRDMDFIKLMHFSSGVVTLLMRHCIVAQLVLLERGFFGDTINQWQMQPCPPCPYQLVNATLMQDSLIAFHESGHVYIFDLTTGICQAHIDILMYCRVRNSEVQCKDLPKIPFRVVAVSNGLEHIVALDDSKIAISIPLKDYFRIFPEHVTNSGAAHEELAAYVCSGDADDERIFDEDDICWSLKEALPFNVDRSWNVQLTQLQDQQKSSSHSAFSGSAFHWVHSQVSPAHLKKPRTRTSLDHLWDHRHDSIEEVSKSTFGLTAISPMTSAHACFLAVGRTTTLLAFTDNGDLTVLLWDISNGSLLPCFSASPGIMVEIDDGDCPCLLLTEQGLSMFILGLSHDELLSRLMVHGSLRLVDSLCLLNQWERCSVPLNALEAGLQNRQLDMLDFFLKSEEHLLDFGSRLTQQDNLSSLSLSQLQNVYRLVPALQLLHRLVQESIDKEATNNFAEELLYRTHTFLHRQLRMLLTNYCQDTDTHVAECTQVLLGFIKDLRQFFRRNHEPKLWHFPSEAEVDSVCVPQIVSWESMSTRDVVKNAIICGCIPAAQAWLKSRQDNCGNLKCLKCLGVNLVDTALQQRDMETTCTLIGNLGFEVSDHLRKVCFHTEDNDLRDFLLEKNEDIGFLNREEQEMARFVQRVESLYNLTCHTVQPKTSPNIRFVREAMIYCINALSYLAC